MPSRGLDRAQEAVQSLPGQRRICATRAQQEPHATLRLLPAHSAGPLCNVHAPGIPWDARKCLVLCCGPDVCGRAKRLVPGCLSAKCVCSPHVENFVPWLAALIFSLHDAASLSAAMPTMTHLAMYLWSYTAASVPLCLHSALYDGLARLKGLPVDHLDPRSGRFVPARKGQGVSVGKFKAGQAQSRRSLLVWIAITNRTLRAAFDTQALRSQLVNLPPSSLAKIHNHAFPGLLQIDLNIVIESRFRPALSSATARSARNMPCSSSLCRCADTAW
jgi:hypothetical protein